MGGYAWVTLATNDSYSLGALVLAHSLRRVGTKHDLVILVSPGVTAIMRERLSSVFSLVREVNLLDSKDKTNLSLLARPELGVTFTKIHCWRLTQYDKCVFLDADTLVVKNCDELFEREELSAAPDVGWPDCFNSGVFVYRPSDETFEKIAGMAVDKGSFDGGDQGLLNMYFNDWAWKDISKHLPFIYNMCSMATYSYLPAFKRFGEDVRIIHFIGKTKPWLQYFDSLTGQVHPSGESHHLRPLLQLWWSIFVAHVHPDLSPAMARSALARNWHPIPVQPLPPPTPTPPPARRPVATRPPDFSEFKDPWENYREPERREESSRVWLFERFHPLAVGPSREDPRDRQKHDRNAEESQDGRREGISKSWESQENRAGQRDAIEKHFQQRHDESQEQHFHCQHREPPEQQFESSQESSHHQRQPSPHHYQQENNFPQQYFKQEQRECLQQHRSSPHFHSEYNEQQSSQRHEHSQQHHQHHEPPRHSFSNEHDVYNEKHMQYHCQYQESAQHSFRNEHHVFPEGNHQHHHESPSNSSHDYHRQDQTHHQQDQTHQQQQQHDQIQQHHVDNSHCNSHFHSTHQDSQSWDQQQIHNYSSSSSHEAEPRQETQRGDDCCWSMNDLSVIACNIATRKNSTTTTTTSATLPASRHDDELRTITQDADKSPRNSSPVPTRTHSPPEHSPRDIATIPDKTGRLDEAHAGIAGALAQMKLGEARSPEQIALEEHMRKQSWEEGQVDYMGRDSFDNIWKKISETLSLAPQRQPTPPKEEAAVDETEKLAKTLKDVTVTSLEKEEQDVRQAEVSDELAADASLTSETPVEDVAAMGSTGRTAQHVTKDEVAAGTGQAEVVVAPGKLQGAATELEKLSSGSVNVAPGMDSSTIALEILADRPAPVASQESSLECSIDAKNLDGQQVVAIPQESCALPCVSAQQTVAPLIPQQQSSVVPAEKPVAEETIATAIVEQQGDVVSIVKPVAEEKVRTEIPQQQSNVDLPVKPIAEGKVPTEIPQQQSCVVAVQKPVAEETVSIASSGAHIAAVPAEIKSVSVEDVAQKCELSKEPTPSSDSPPKIPELERQLSERIAVASETTSASPVPIQVAESVLQTEPKTALESRECELASEEAISTMIAPIREVATRSAEILREDPARQVVPTVAACNGGEQESQDVAQVARVVEAKIEQRAETGQSEQKNEPSEQVAETRASLQEQETDASRQGNIVAESRAVLAEPKTTTDAKAEEARVEPKATEQEKPISDEPKDCIQAVPIRSKDAKPEDSATTVEAEVKTEGIEKTEIAEKKPETRAPTEQQAQPTKEPEVKLMFTPATPLTEAQEPEMPARPTQEQPELEQEAGKTEAQKGGKKSGKKLAKKSSEGEIAEGVEEVEKKGKKPTKKSAEGEVAEGPEDVEKKTKKLTKKSSEGEVAEEAEKKTKKLTKKSSESEVVEGAEDAEKKTKKLTKKSSEGEVAEGAEDAEKKTKKLTKKSSESEGAEGADEAEKKTTTKKVVKKSAKKPKEGGQPDDGADAGAVAEKPKRSAKPAKKSAKSATTGQEAEPTTPETAAGDVPVPPKRKPKTATKKPDAE